MYIAKVTIRNFRCFSDTTVEFQPGVNVIIGENNAGKTNLLKALMLVFDRRGRLRPSAHDFYRLLAPLDNPPTINVAVTLRSSQHDSPADRALVASWLVKLDAPWEAQLTYLFFLPEQDAAEFKSAVAGVERDRFFEILEEFIPKYVSRVYGGNPESKVVADGESMNKFDPQFLDALRDVETEMFTGSTPLFRRMLEEVLDFGIPNEERRHRRQSFRAQSDQIRDTLVSRLDTQRLFNLVTATGAGDGGTPTLHGAVEETDIMAALRLFVSRQHFSLPATHNGLGYNNLLYISLVLASLRFRTSIERLGQNAAIFPMLLIEEPEAHLHPALQYKLLAHIRERVQAEPRQNRQIFLTTHSTHVTAAAGLEPIVCLSLDQDSVVHVSYPSRLFADTDSGRESRRYVERYLDATKSAMLFAKSTILVEGIAEQLLVPTIANRLGRSFDEHHVALMRVDGLTFKHFLPMFGAGHDAIGRAGALPRRVACVIDADPARRAKVEKARRTSCLPFQIDTEMEQFDYFPVSGAVSNLNNLVAEAANIRIYHGVKTLEYEIALQNAGSQSIVTGALPHAGDLRILASNLDQVPDGLSDLLADDELADLEKIADIAVRRRTRFAALYLRCADGNKGEHAFALEQQLRAAAAPGDAFVCPEYIRNAIEWVTPTADQPHQL